MVDTNAQATSGHEEDYVGLRPVASFAVALTILGVVVHLGLWWMFQYFEKRELRQRPPAFPLARDEGQQLPKTPRLEGIVRPQEGDRYLPGSRGREAEEEELLLQSHDWVDKDGGVVRIPIAKAMEQVIHDLNGKTRPAPSPRPLPSDANSGRPVEANKP